MLERHGPIMVKTPKAGMRLQFKSLDAYDEYSGRSAENAKYAKALPDVFVVVEVTSSGSITKVLGLSCNEYKLREDVKANHDKWNIIDNDDFCLKRIGRTIIDSAHPDFYTPLAKDVSYEEICINAGQIIFTKTEANCFLKPVSDDEDWWNPKRPMWQQSGSDYVPDYDVQHAYLTQIKAFSQQIAENSKPEVKDKKIKTPRGVKETTSLHINKTIGSDKGAQELVNFIRSKFKVV